MASTNTNTSLDNTSVSENIISTDIYEISEFIENIRDNNIDDLSETSSMVGIFGYTNEIFSQTLQNTLIVVSETSNETIPTKAKFSKNVITHALNNGIRKITATPAVMTLMIYLPISYIETNFVELDTTTGKGKFIFDKDVPIYIDKFEYHVDYDIIFTRTRIPTGEYQYSAMYDLFESGSTSLKQNNPISDITNPYITTLIKYTIDKVDYLAFSVRVHQVSHIYEEKTILTDNSIENKTITFEFDDQLAAFDVDVIEKDKTIHLTPIYEGLIDITVDDGKWCNYEYLDENTIIIKFNRDSYVPPVNSTVRVNIKLTEGADGNFNYNQNFKTSLESEKYNNYNGMYALVYPLLEGRSSGGINKKSIKEIRKIIPREASSRGAISNTTDLNNFFNSINDDECKIYSTKKRDNPFERLYYCHMVMRKDAYVYPTNTLNLYLTQKDFNGITEANNLSINPGTKFYYYDHGSDIQNDYATVIEPNNYIEDEGLGYRMVINADGDKKRVFEYISPFLITIDKDLITSYLLTIMNDNKTFKFDSINTYSDLQFVATNMNWTRKYKYDYIDENGKTKQGTYDNKYTMTVSMTQNNQIDYGLIQYHMDANNNIVFDDIRVKMFMVLYTDETSNIPYRYAEAELVDYEEKGFIYDFKFTLETDDLMDLNNRINIKGVYNAKPEEYQKLANISNSHGYLNNNTYCKIFILADFGNKKGDKLADGTVVSEDIINTYGEDNIGNRTELQTIIPTRDDIVTEFLKNNVEIIDNNETLNVCTIIRTHQVPNPENISENINDWMIAINEYNGNDLTDNNEILKYIRNFKDDPDNWINTELLLDEKSIKVIEAYHYEDLSRYTVCNTFTVDNGVDFYYDYSNIMNSVVNISQVNETTDEGDILYTEIVRTDSLGKSYTEYQPIYKVNENGTYYYDYTINRIPMIKNGFLSTEAKMQDFIYEIEERRKYINECLNVLEDTFGIDLKFFNTFGPSRKFYHNDPNSTTFKVKVTIPEVNIYSSTVDEDDESKIVGKLNYGSVVLVEKVKGQWGYITNPGTGWIKLSNVTKVTNYIDNVSLSMRFALEAQTSSDKYIKNNIIFNIKDYIEDINEITELHIPNIITLITNAYREQLVYFEYLGLNDYGTSCQHLYLDETPYTDITPEFLNIATDDETDTPEIDITVY